MLLEKYFQYKKHGTDFKTEVIAGITTFLTMAYIMFLNPVILADGGLILAAFLQPQFYQLLLPVS